MTEDKPESSEQAVQPDRKMTPSDVISVGSHLLEKAKTEDEKEQARRIIHKGRVAAGISTPEEDRLFQVIPQSIRRKLM